MTIPATMRALVLDHDGYDPTMGSGGLETLDGFVTLKTVDVPRPRAGQVLIRVGLSPINPSDVAFIKGAYGQPRVAGRPAGFEGVGEVVASGGGFLANRLKGRRVAFFAGISGAWAEYAVASAMTCIVLRKDVSDEDGAALLVNPFSAFAMVDIARRRGAGAFVMTAGASQLCKLMAGLARDRGIAAIALVRREAQIEPMKRAGAAAVLDTESPDFEAALEKVLKAHEPSILFDALGGGVAEPVFRAMGDEARWVIYGGLAALTAPLPDPGQFIFRKKRIEGFWLTEWLAKAGTIRTLLASRAVQARFASGVWKTELADRVSLAEAHAKVPGYFSGANPGKVMLTP